MSGAPGRGGGVAGGALSSSKLTLWEPSCVFANFPHAVVCGDSWGGSNLVLGTADGTFLIANNRPPVRLQLEARMQVGSIRACELEGRLIIL